MVRAGSHEAAATRTKRRLFINILEIRRHGGFSQLQIADVQNLTASFPLPIQNDCHVVWSEAGLGRGGRGRRASPSQSWVGAQGPRTLTEAVGHPEQARASASASLS